MTMSHELQEAAPPSPREVKTVFAGLMLALALASLDQNIVGVALPRIVSDLGGSPSPLMGRHLLSRDLHCDDAALREALRHVRQETALYRRDRHLPHRLLPLRPVALHDRTRRVSAGSRAWARAASWCSRRPRSPTSWPPANGAATRGSSARSSLSRALPDRFWAGSSPTPCRGAGSST